MQSILITICLLAMSLIITGCNTMEGMGKDIKAGGEKIEKTADRHKN
jgi:entericidin B